jgi:hypothetical protein
LNLPKKRAEREGDCIIGVRADFKWRSLRVLGSGAEDDY